MDIFTPITKTREEVIADTLKQNINSLLSSIVTGHDENYNLTWFSTDVDQQKIMDALGPEATKLFLIGSIFASAINAITQSDVSKIAQLAQAYATTFVTIAGVDAPTVVHPSAPAGYTITFNSDGTVTIVKA